MTTTKEKASPFSPMHFETIDHSIRNKDWRNLLICTFDFETTGLDVATSRITQISANISRKSKNPIEDYEIVDSLNILVNPKEPVPEIVTKKTGLTNKILDNEPAIDEPDKDGLTPIDKLAAFMSMADMTGGFNVISFDFPIFKYEMLRTGVEYEFNIPVYDAYIWGRLYQNYRKSGTLLSFAKRFNVAVAGKVASGMQSAHNGSVDVEMTTGLIWKFSEGVMTSYSLFDLMRKQLNTLMEIELLDSK